MSTMTRVGNAIICREPMEEIHRESVGERWCFCCRKQREFHYVIDAPIAMSYYGPNPYIQCSECRTMDGDLFPGRSREWED